MHENIFINYRREEAQSAAGRLYDLLENAFGREYIFFDVDSIAPGKDFVEELSARVAECDIFLAVVGRGWIDVKDHKGGRRIDNSTDWVRIEIESALEQKKHVIPVLVDGAEMPRPENLPPSLASFARKHAVRLTHDRFRSDVQGLVDAVNKLRETWARQEEERQKRQTEREEAARRRAAEAEAHAEAERKVLAARQKEEEKQWLAATKVVKRAVEEERREAEQALGDWQDADRAETERKALALRQAEEEYRSQVGAETTEEEEELSEAKFADVQKTETERVGAGRESLTVGDKQYENRLDREGEEVEYAKTEKGFSLELAAIGAFVVVGFVIYIVSENPQKMGGSLDTRTETAQVELPKPAGSPAQLATPPELQKQETKPTQAAVQPEGPLSADLIAATPNWRKVCGADSQTKKPMCYTTRDFGVPDREGKVPQPVLALAVYDPKGDNQKIIRLMLPPGLMVKPGFRFAFDSGAMASGAFEICFPNGCFAEAKVKKAVIDSMKEAEKMTLIVKNQKNAEVTFYIPLAGFGKAYDGPAIDPKELEDDQRKLQDELKAKK